ncbi:MAG TPA: fumarylacetoacetate hydrolase family protein [Roseiflexaceae bacterium]|nr:fumarylacetoacetate hydrolase family protein [Roseiflexaceae bacterium]
MHLVTFVREDGTHIGALQQRDGRQMIVDLNRAEPRLPNDMIAFLAGGDESRVLAAQALADPPAEAVLDRNALRLSAPIPRPGKIICIGLNYRDHAAESNQPVPEYPTVFAKYSSCVIGPGESIVIPRVTSQVDYEGELAVVIGRRARDVAEQDALSYVAGYAPFNDVSARDYQGRTSQWTIGKTFDTFGPIGPALVTADEISDPHSLDIRVTIGDDVLQSSNTRHLIFSIPQLIAYLSAVMTLEPGDVIATGTPAGVGAARKPARWLQPGELVRVEIDGLGTLENPVVAST